MEFVGGKCDMNAAIEGEEYKMKLEAQERGEGSGGRIKNNKYICFSKI